MRNKLLYISVFLFSAIALFQACDNEEGINYQRYYVYGKGVYEKHCQNCHGADGKGLRKLYPPLTDTTYLTKNKAALACIIKFGMNHDITIQGTEYDGQMPGNDQLADIDIAQVIVYITNSFGNQQGYYDASKVAADLKNCQ